MRIYIGLLICSLLLLVVLILGYADSQLPAFGFEAFRASPGWRAALFVGASAALPSLVIVSLVLSLIGVIYEAVTRKLGPNQPNQPGNQPNQLPQPTNQHVQLSRPRDDGEGEWDGQISQPIDAAQAVLIPEPLEPGELSFAIKRAVLTTAAYDGDMTAAAEKLGVGYEAVRKSVAQARKEYPDWTNWHVPPKR